MSRRRLKVSDLPPEYIGAVNCLDDADRIFKRNFGDRQVATRQEFAPQGWSKARYYIDKVFFVSRESI